MGAPGYCCPLRRREMKVTPRQGDAGRTRVMLIRTYCYTEWNDGLVANAVVKKISNFSVLHYPPLQWCWENHSSVFWQYSCAWLLLISRGMKHIYIFQYLELSTKAFHLWDMRCPVSSWGPLRMNVSGTHYGGVQCIAAEVCVQHLRCHIESTAMCVVPRHEWAGISLSSRLSPDPFPQTYIAYDHTLTSLPHK